MMKVLKERRKPKPDPEAVQSVLDAFHALQHPDDRMEVCATIYFELYRRSVSEVMASRMVQSLNGNMDELKQKIEELEGENQSLRQKVSIILEDNKALKARIHSRIFPLNPATARDIYEHMTPEEKNDFKTILKEDKVIKNLKIDIKTKSERVQLLERLLDDSLSEIGQLKSRIKELEEERQISYETE